MLLGAHLSIAGGLHRSLERAHEYGFDCVALFLHNQRQWKPPPLTHQAIDKFHTTRQRLHLREVIAHASYLVNLAGRPAVRRKSIAAMREDIKRCQQLGIKYLVLHPGSNPNLEKGINLIADALNRLIEDGGEAVKILLETTAGQGNSIGWQFEHLSAIIDRLDKPHVVGLCLDTCHIFAAGYDIRSAGAYRKTMQAFERIIGLDKLKVIHLNDSLKDLGSRIDRHWHIGRGKIGLEGFSNIVNDPRLQALPMILETPKGHTEDGLDWDVINADTIRSLLRQ